LPQNTFLGQARFTSLEDIANEGELISRTALGEWSRTILSKILINDMIASPMP
jgi:hypothetical protein